MRAKSPVAFLVLCVASALVVCAFFIIPNALGQSYDKGAVVKLYSGDNVVATWESVTTGHTDGNTFVFEIGSRTSPVEVRICGTYSVERIP